MKKKKLAFLILGIAVIVGIVLIIANQIKLNNNKKTTFEGNMASSTIILDDIEFKNMTKIFENGVTTIRADVYNNTKESKTINVKIILKDDLGKEVKSMIQILENIESGKKKILQTGIMGNYSNIKEVEFKVLSNQEVNKLNS